MVYNSHVFNLPELTRGVRVGNLKALTTCFHASFSENELLFPCAHLKEYDLRSKDLRPEAVTEPKKLFLSVNNSHKSVSAATLSHRLRDCLFIRGCGQQPSV